MEEQLIVVPISALQALLQDIQGLKDQIKALEERQDQDCERLARDIAQDRQRIARLEYKEPEQDSKVIDELYKEMKAQGRRQTDFATAARMTKRTKGRLHQLKAAIALDPRFIIVHSESHRQKLLIRLRTE